jgi:hypothetical protein
VTCFVQPLFARRVGPRVYLQALRRRVLADSHSTLVQAVVSLHRSLADTRPCWQARGVLFASRYTYGPQTTSEHYLPLWGMKPTVLDHCNLLDLHTLARTHLGLLTRRRAALGANQGGISQTRSSSFPTRVNDALTRAVLARLRDC